MHFRVGWAEGRVDVPLGGYLSVEALHVVPLPVGHVDRLDGLFDEVQDHAS